MIAARRAWFSAETLTHFDVQFRRRSITDFVVVPVRRRPGGVVQSLTACVWLRTDDHVNYGTLWSYAVDSNWLDVDAASNAFTAYDYASLKVNRSARIGAYYGQTGPDLRPTSTCYILRES